MPVAAVPPDRMAIDLGPEHPAGAGRPSATQALNTTTGA